MSSNPSPVRRRAGLYMRIENNMVLPIGLVAFVLDLFRTRKVAKVQRRDRIHEYHQARLRHDELGSIRARLAAKRRQDPNSVPLTGELPFDEGSLRFLEAVCLTDSDTCTSLDSLEPGSA